MFKKKSPKSAEQLQKELMDAAVELMHCASALISARTKNTTPAEMLGVATAALCDVTDGFAEWVKKEQEKK